MDASADTVEGEGVKDFMFLLLVLILAGLILYGGIEAFVAFNLWLGEMAGWTYK